MNRGAIFLLALGAASITAFAAFQGARALPSFFAAWLFWLGLPMGALALVMGMEAVGSVRSALLPVLRAMLPLLPLALLLAEPMVGGLHTLFARPHLAAALPPWWTASVGVRDGLVLLVLSLLALTFAVPTQRPRRRLARLGLLLHLVLATLLAVDFLVAPDPSWGSPLAGLLLIAGQAVEAVAFAGLAVAVAVPPRGRLPAGAGALMSALAAFWLLLNLLQFTVSWSANLPAEASWYLARAQGGGGVAVAFAAVSAILTAALLPTLLGRVPIAMATLSSMVLLSLLLATLLFVLPAYRGHPGLQAADGLAVLGLGGLMMGAMLLLLPPKETAR